MDCLVFRESVDTVGRCTTSYLLAGPSCLWYLVWCSTMYGDRAGYLIVDSGGWKRGVGPNCMENEEFFCLEWCWLQPLLTLWIERLASAPSCPSSSQESCNAWLCLGGKTKAPQVVFPHVLNIHKWGHTKPSVNKDEKPKMKAGGKSCQYYKDLVSYAWCHRLSRNKGSE